MNICIVGGSGFIGTQTAKLFSAAGHKVVIVDIKTPQIDCIFYKRDVRLCEFDDIFSVEKIDIVYNLAAVIFANECKDDPVRAIETNVRGLHHVLDGCIKTGVKKIVFSSTVHVYESALARDVDENTILDIRNGQNIYITSKLIGEQLIKSYNLMYGLNYTIYRYGVAYGVGGHKSNVVSKFTDLIKTGKEITILGDPNKITRSFLNVVDHARANYIAILDIANNDTFNIDSGRSVSLGELVSIIESVVGKKAIIRVDDQRVSDYNGKNVSNEKASSILSWAPTVTLEEGISQL